MGTGGSNSDDSCEETVDVLEQVITVAHFGYKQVVREFSQKAVDPTVSGNDKSSGPYCEWE